MFSLLRPSSLPYLIQLQMKVGHLSEETAVVLRLWESCLDQTGHRLKKQADTTSSTPRVSALHFSSRAISAFSHVVFVSALPSSKHVFSRWLNMTGKKLKKALLVLLKDLQPRTARLRAKLGVELRLIPLCLQLPPPLLCRSRMLPSSGVRGPVGHSHNSSSVIYTVGR